MKITKAEFIISSTDIKKCPPDDKPEYAFIGRSNVGKSSFINMLTGRKNLARTSSSPGKTTLINHFLIDDSWYLVDLPGFGYAKISKSERERWKKMINNYLLNRRNLLYSFLLIDSRLEPQKNDTEFINWFGKNALPFVLLFTKTDKLNSKELSQSIETYRRHLSDYWEILPPLIVSSAKTKVGKDKVLDFINQNNKIFYSSE